MQTLSDIPVAVMLLAASWISIRPLAVRSVRVWRHALIAIAVSLLALRFVYLQVVSFEEFSTRSTSNQVRVTPVAPNRGLIYDRRGRPVAKM